MQSAPLIGLFLGEEPLLMRCAEAWLSRGHSIRAIVTQTEALMRWAQGRGIAILGRGKYEDELERQPIDVLLSVTYPAIIPSRCIARARVAAVNYHDGPLPRYAGMNGSAWALVNRETSHAIVWHTLTAGLDEGDVLERRDIELESRETSVSLNMRNSALALESFEVLVARMEARDLKGTPQSASVARTVFSRHDRPDALGLIDWSAPVGDVDALIRACDFGNYTNPFASAKIVFGHHALIVRTATPCEDTYSAQVLPGTVLAMDSDKWRVACGDGYLRITRVSTLTGDSLDLKSAANYLGVSVGCTVAISAAQWAHCSTLSRVTAMSETHWVRALANRALPTIAFEAASQTHPTSLDVPLPIAFREAYASQLPHAVVSLFGFVLSCIVRQDVFDFAWVSAGSHVNEPDWAAASAVYLASVPHRMEVNASEGFADLVQRQCSTTMDLANRPHCLSDLIARHPGLRDATDLRRGCVSPIAIITDHADGQFADLPEGTLLALAIDSLGHSSLWISGQYAPSVARELARYMVVLAEQVAESPARPMATVDLLDSGSRRKQIIEWNSTSRPFPDTLRIHELFEAQVKQRPNAVALAFEGATISFDELERRANRVANALQARGAKVGDYVAVMVERGFDLVATLLGIAKSGAAYLPIDPSYPQDRVHFMLEDARCDTVLVSPGLAAGLNYKPQALLVFGCDALSLAPDTRPECPAAASDVCYTIYTSGSTGMPKGVVLTHRAVVNTLDWVNRQFGVGPDDRLLFVTSPSFDLSVYDIFGALGAGASVDIASRALLGDPARLTQHVVSQGITIWDSAPPAMARLTPFLPEFAARSVLRLVMLSGDWIPLWLPTTLMKVFPAVQVKSLGGATEAAIWSNYFPVSQVDPTWASIPYGYPIQNARYYILDHHLRPAPVGLQGDLYIAGECLARGYLNREELTTERFVVDPFCPGQRMYKTGDLARYWADGTMEFLGRADFQVKIRGYRVEIGEVEAAIRALPNVRDAVCTTWVDGSDQKALVAYVTPVGALTVDVNEIKSSLAASLPDFMVPSHVILLEAMPLTSNGKLDRKALPSPSVAQIGRNYRPPATDTERSLVELWQSVLKRKPIGITDNFFEIGGHSLLAVTLMAQLKSHLQVSVPLSRIIERPTIEQFAQSLDSESKGRPKPANDLIELKMGGTNHLFFIHDGDGETLLYRTLAQRLPDRFSVWGIPPRTMPSVPMVDRTVPAMAAAYIERMRRCQPHGPYCLAGLCAGGVIAYEMALQLERMGESVDLLAILDAVEPRAPSSYFATSQRRLQRLFNVFVDEQPQRRPWGGLAVIKNIPIAVSKTWNLIRYEMSSTVQASFVSARLWVLNRAIENCRPWPAWLPPLETRHIYLAAKARYDPGRLHGGQVVIMRAEDGSDPDVLAMQDKSDRTLGWGRVVRGSIRTLDVHGGHTSMLQDPYVESLAQQFSILLSPISR